MCQLGRLNLALMHDLDAINAFNKMHASCKVRVEWGIGGLKCKWMKLMKIFNSKKGKYTHFFLASIILINYLHMDFTYEVIGNQIQDLVDYIQDENFYKSSNSLTLALKFTFVKTLIFLATFKLANLTCFFFYMLISIFALIMHFWSSLFICISHAMVAKLLDYTCNTLIFVFKVPLDMLVNVGPKVDEKKCHIFFCEPNVFSRYLDLLSFCLFVI